MSSTTYHASYPPKELEGDSARTAQWFEEHTPKPVLQEDLTAREKELVRMSATDYIAARKAGKVTCEEYAAALVKRMAFYQHMNQFTLVSYSLTDVILEQAKKMDQRASENIENIAPLYGLPIPLKGTMATKDFPSCAGVSLLAHVYGIKDCAMVDLLKKANAVLMGKTNIPQFAASFITANPHNGVTFNAYHDGSLTSGGSSGGSASAVATFIAPLAITEDTGGSTRHPAMQNHNYGYDPSRNHYPNEGNPGICYTNDQIGVNARSFEDILLFDSVLLGTAEAHANAAKEVSARTAKDIRVGFPLFPFVELELPSNALNVWGVRNCSTSDSLRTKYESVKKALSAEGVTTVDEEWPAVDSSAFGPNTNALLHTLWADRQINNKPFDGVLAPNLYSFTGQMSQWIHEYLGSTVSVQEVWDASPAMGDAHNPRGFYSVGRALCDETQFRYVSIAQAEKLAAYNLYFDTHNVDAIIIPPQYGDALKFSQAANSTIPLRVKNADGSYQLEPASALQCNFPYLILKDIPFPKVVVPTGLDEQGRPTAVVVLGRGVPVDKLYDDAYAVQHDIKFLHVVDRINKIIQARPELARQNAAGVTANLF